MFMVQPNIDIWITSIFPIMISPLVSSYVSHKDFTLKELNWIQEVCKNHSADHYMLSPEAIDTLGIKIEGSTVKAYTLTQFRDICSFVKNVLSKEKRPNANNIARWIKQKHNIGKRVSYDEIFFTLKEHKA